MVLHKVFQLQLSQHRKQQAPKAERQLTDSELYERAQKQVLPKYIQGSLSGILNQHSTLNV
ncbi:hypothetical protein [Streptococcus agalactiae]|uniref:hypothetical protein n=1 Tax=Streptococcus agalactiae TaxID=1311 RepID=UPI001E59F307